MVAINESDFIKEAVFCIKESDFIKAQALFFYFPKISAPFQNRLLYEISKAPDEMAYKLIQHISSLTITEEEVREKLYEVIMDKAYRSSDFVLKLIKTGSPENKRVILKVIKNLKLKSAIPDLLDMLGSETDIKILQDALKVMAKIGDDSCISAIADFVFYGDPGLKSAAVYSLAEIRSAKALEALKEISGTAKVDQLILDTIAASIDLLESILHEEEELEAALLEEELAEEEAVEEEISATSIEVPEVVETITAKAPAKPKDAPPIVVEAPVEPKTPVQPKKVTQTAPPLAVKKKDIVDKEKKLPVYQRLLKMLKSDGFKERYSAIEQFMGAETGKKEERLIELLESDTLAPSDIDLKINALKILDFINSEDTVDAIRKLFYSNPADDNLKFAVYDIVKNIPQFKSVISIIDGLEDRNELIRMASSCAMNELLSDVHIEGIKSKIETVGDVSQKIVEAIVDSQSVNIFEALIGSDAFMSRAINHLSYHAYPQTRNFFIKYLTDRGNVALAGTIGEIISGFDAKRPVIFVVHGSKTVQHYFNKILYKFFNVFSFSTPEEAILAIINNTIEKLPAPTKDENLFNIIIPDLLLTDLYLDDIDGISFSDLFKSLFEDGGPETMIISDRIESGLKNITSHKFFNLALNKTKIIEDIKKTVGTETKALQRKLFIAGINQLVQSSFINLRPAGIALLEKTGANTLNLLKENLKTNDTFLISKTLDIIGNTGNQKTSKTVCELALESASALVRSSAYSTMGKLLFQNSSMDVSQILKEKNYCTKLSAVRYLDKIVDAKIVGELKNLTETSGKISKDITAAIIDSHSFNIFNKLIKFDTFAELATFHLSRNVHQTTRDFFLDKLKAQGLNRIVRSVQGDVDVFASEDENLIFIVTDSKIRISIFTNLLNLPSLSLIPMENWKEAMEMIVMAQPKLIISDLYIQGASVLKYLRMVKRELGKETVPVAVISNIDDFKGLACLDQSKRISKDNLNCFGIKKVFSRPMDLKLIKAYVTEVVAKK